MPASVASQAAALLAEARQSGVKLDDLPPAWRPETPSAAYAIQDAVAARSGPVGGWKAGAEPDGGFAFAPIPAAAVRWADSPVAAPARLEVELGLLLGADLPAAAAPFAPAEVAAAVAAAHVVVEVLGHRFIDQNAVSRLTYLADGNGNQAVIIGDSIPNWRDLDLAALDVRLEAGGVTVAQGGRGAGYQAVLELLTALADHAAAHGGGLAAGQIVITGARAGPVVFSGGTAIGSINGARVSLTASATPPPA